MAGYRRDKNAYNVLCGNPLERTPWKRQDNIKRDFNEIRLLDVNFILLAQNYDPSVDSFQHRGDHSRFIKKWEIL